MVWATGSSKLCKLKEDNLDYFGFFTFSVGYPPSQNDVEVAEDCFQVSI